jgi:hypothetical protein
MGSCTYDEGDGPCGIETVGMTSFCGEHQLRGEREQTVVIDCPLQSDGHGLELPSDEGEPGGVNDTSHEHS